MPKFILYEERTEVYTITIEAKNREDAKRLYEAGDQAVDQWEPESSNGCELVSIVELNKAGEPIEEGPPCHRRRVRRTGSRDHR